MHMDPILPVIVAAAFAILLVGMVLRRLNQPRVIAYLLAGVLIGPEGLGLFTDVGVVARLGDVGVMFLLFFVGMEVSFPHLAAGWRISLIGTVLQIAVTIGVIVLVGAWLDWSTPRTAVVAFSISLSSTAVVVSLLRASNRLDTEAGRDALGILLVQDVMLIPMLIGLDLLGGTSHSTGALALEFLGALMLVGLLAVLARKEEISLPFGRLLRSDEELQIFSAFLLCFGFAMAAGLMGLSTALGAFVAGVVISVARETAWVHRSLDSYRVIFVALFFVSVGMLIDLGFLAENWEMLLGLVVLTLLLNTSLNAVILRGLGRPWGPSVYIGSLLSQVGEFAFVLAAVGRNQGLISDFAYQLILGLIVGTLVLSPAWIGLARKLVGSHLPPAPERLKPELDTSARHGH
jgi:CPA2 family monovalent cation:H+ antiporter-2